MAPSFLTGPPTMVHMTDRYCVEASTFMLAGIGKLQRFALTKQIIFVASVEKFAVSRKSFSRLPLHFLRYRKSFSYLSLSSMKESFDSLTVFA